PRLRHDIGNRNARVDLLHHLSRAGCQGEGVSRGAQLVDHLAERLSRIVSVRNVGERPNVTLERVRRAFLETPMISKSVGVLPRPSKTKCRPRGFSPPKYFLTKTSLTTATRAGLLTSRSPISRPSRMGICMVLKNQEPTLSTSVL